MLDCGLVGVNGHLAMFAAGVVHRPAEEGV